MSDILYVQDLINRWEELEALFDEKGEPIDPDDRDDKTECVAIGKLLDELQGNGGNIEWCGEWYPGELIPDSEFGEYARSLVYEMGLRELELEWPLNCLDWDVAAEELKTDYMSVYYEGETYWYR